MPIPMAIQAFDCLLQAFDAEARAPVDVIGREAANVREHANVKYKTLG